MENNSKISTPPSSSPTSVVALNHKYLTQLFSLLSLFSIQYDYFYAKLVGCILDQKTY